MDRFNVPQKVNRHVLKALSVLGDGDLRKAISVNHICQQVKYQMRNLVPVPNVDRVIKKSLRNMSLIGLIERKDQRHFCMGKKYTPLNRTQPNNPDRKHFRTVNRQTSRSILNPNLKRRSTFSEDSLSGDEFDRTRKRMRSNNKQPKHVGRFTHLPRARQYRKPTNLLRLNQNSLLCDSKSTIAESLSGNNNFGSEILSGFPQSSFKNIDVLVPEIAHSANNVEIRTSEVGTCTENSELGFREGLGMQESTQQASTSNIMENKLPCIDGAASISLVKTSSVLKAHDRQQSDTILFYIN